MRSRVLVARLVLVGLVGCWAPKAPSPEHEEARYPRLATYFIESHVDEAVRATMAKTDVVIVDAEAGALDRVPLDALRRARPDLLLLAYLTSEELPYEPSLERPLAEARFYEVPPEAWLVDPGSTLVDEIDATSTQLRVRDPSAFTITRPPSPFYGANEPTYLLVGGEHMRLVAIEGDVLTVERGFRSEPAAHAAGAHVASHVVFFAGTWMLNITEPAWRTILAGDAEYLVAVGPWNGIFLDVCFEDIAWLNGGVVDLDRDGAPDRDASARWSRGMRALVDTVRDKVGPRVPIVSNPGAQDCPHERLDGIMLEGWPIGLPPRFLAFDVGLARYLRWSRKPPHLTIANAYSPKIGFGAIKPGDDELARTDYAAMRFGLGLALMGDGYYTFDNGVFGHYVAWWYDEYDGAGRGLRWLGRAHGAPRQHGTLAWRVFDHGLAVVNMGTAPARFVPPAGYAKLAGKQDPVHNDGKPVTGALVVPARDAYVLATAGAGRGARTPGARTQP